MAARILAVDDSPLILKLVEKMLSQAGYQVHAATSGPKALAQVKEIQPDLAILDVSMPDMDGYEVCRRLRQDPATAQLPIMMLTALDSLENKIKGFEAGADDYMAKPFQGAELQARVEALLRRSVRAKSLPAAPKTKVIAVFSLRGGIGVSTVAVNLAAGLAQIWEKPVALVDLAFTAGQAALMLNLPLRHTWADLSSISLEELETNLLNDVLLQHPCGVHVLAAPRRAEESTLVDAERVSRTITALGRSHPYVVLDVPHDLQDTSLAGLDAAHQIVTLMAPELASIRALSGAHDVFEMLQYPAAKIQLVLNNTFERHGLARRDIEATLKREIDLEIPYAPDLFVQAVNTGLPPVVDSANSFVGGLLEDYAFRLSQEEHKTGQPETPSAAWRRVMRRAQKRSGKK